MRKVAYFLLGLAFGGLVGSAVALLYTPKSGDDLRSEIYDYTDNLSTEVKKAAVERRRELENQLAQLRGEIITD